jgi:hypothetical protein
MINVSMPTVTRGNWSWGQVTTWSGAKTGAWRLSDTSWWLRRRSGAAESLDWCGYCYRPPYQWYHLHSTPPETWLLASPYSWSMSDTPSIVDGKETRIHRCRNHGTCTHHHLLKDAMAVSEAAIDRWEKEQVLRSLAALRGMDLK